jgi:hypothetical protein
LYKYEIIANAFKNSKLDHKYMRINYFQNMQKDCQDICPVLIFTTVYHVWLWLGLDFLEAKPNGSGHGFEHNFKYTIATNYNYCSSSLASIKIKIPVVLIAVDRFWTDLA